MANFRRKKPRHRTRTNVTSMNSWPAWWDVIYHRRPARRRAAAIKGKILRGEIDADSATWPVGKKPHNYYW